MTLDQLRQLCEEAARDLVTRTDPPHPTTIVLPGPDATRVTALPDFPDDDVARFELLARFAADEMVPRGAPCYGFLAEAVNQAGDNVLVVVYGARRHRPHVTAAELRDGTLGPFVAAEPLDPTAMPFLQPLQHAADTAAPDALGGIGPQSGQRPPA